MSEAIIRGWRTLDLLSSFPQIPEKKQSFSLCLNLSFLSCFASSRGDSVGGDVDVVGGGVSVGVGGGVVLGSVEVEKSRLKSHPLPLVKQSLRKSAAVSGAVTPLGLAVVVVVVIVDSVELT